jgi:drug/metabolite transporter (DMT)-like permease
MRGSPQRTTLAAFAAVVLLGGVNGTAIHLGNQELAPEWGATLRFGLAALVLFGIVVVRRLPLPRGRALAASALYGLLSFGVTFALVNWALVDTPPGTAQVILALVPLLTLVLAAGQGLEKLRLQSIVGSLVSVAGIVLIFGERASANVPLISMLAVLGGAISISEANVVAKRLPRCHPVANNAIGMAVGALFLGTVSVILGEPHGLPQQPSTLLALGYLSLIGSVVVFSLYLFIIERWTASATSYALLLMPLVSVVVAAIVVNEPITLILVGGALLVLAGVYVGAFAPSLWRLLPPRPLAGRPALAPAEVTPPVIATPTCP